MILIFGEVLVHPFCIYMIYIYSIYKYIREFQSKTSLLPCLYLHLSIYITISYCIYIYIYLHTHLSSLFYVQHSTRTVLRTPVLFSWMANLQRPKICSQRFH